jgi:type VI secretion system protein ImpJ
VDDKRPFDTARVRWRMGQPLLPEHFYAQEESLRAEVNLRHGLLATPQWGVGTLSWELNPAGRVRIKRLELLGEDGALIDVPGNCDAPAAVDLSAAGESKVALFLHRGPESRFTHDSPLGEPDNVERTVYQVELSPHASADPDAEPFKLAELLKSVDDEWVLSEAYIPPSISVARSPFFQQPLLRMRRVVDALHEALVLEIRDAFLSAEGTTSAKLCLRSVFMAQALLADVTAGDLDLHPAELWRALTGLYVDLCVHRSMSPTVHLVPYRHRQLGPCFNRVLDALEAQVEVRRTETPHAVFQPEGNMQVCELPSEARRARQVYWLVQKARIGDTLKLEQLKLAGPERLAAVHQLALRGVPFRPILSPPFHHNFTAEVDFYALERGEEWDHALREGKLAFYSKKELEGVRSFIYWRND